MSAPFLDGDSLYADVCHYAELGEHRTATSVDERTTAWVARELALAGLEVSLQPFHVDQFELRESGLRLGDELVGAFPAWPPRPTGFEGVVGALVTHPEAAPPDGGHLAILRWSYDPRASLQEVHVTAVADAARRGAAAALVVTEAPSGEIVAWNDPGAPRWPIPVALVASRDEPRLAQAASRAQAACLVVDGSLQRAVPVHNTVARLARPGPALVVSTPQSGWFRCGGERGPGIALLLGLARWAASRPGGPGLTFVVTTGHELGGPGMDLYLDEAAPPPADVRAWIHLGAGIATTTWEEQPGRRTPTGRLEPRRLLMASAELESVVERHLGQLPFVRAPGGLRVGELAPVSERGYRALGIAGAHHLHHTPADGAASTSPGLLEPIADALRQTIASLGRSPA